jgi:hypothetical protein
VHKKGGLDREKKKKLFYLTLLFQLTFFLTMVFQVITAELQDLQNPLLTVDEKNQDRLYAKTNDKSVFLNIHIKADLDDGEIQAQGIRIPEAVIKSIDDKGRIEFLLDADVTVPLSKFADLLETQFKALYPESCGIGAYWNSPILVKGKKHKSNDQQPVIGSKVYDLVVIPGLLVNVLPAKNTPEEELVTAPPKTAFNSFFWQIASWSDVSPSASTATATLTVPHRTPAPPPKHRTEKKPPHP